MENLIQLQAQLQKLPDQSLAQYMHQPSAQVPPFMVMMEMQRRAQARKQAQAPQMPPPTTTVAQDLEAQDAGLGSLGMQAPQGFAEGGIVGYADGGTPDDEDNTMPLLRVGRYLESLMPQPAYARGPMPGIDDMIGSTQRGMLDYINGLGKPRTTATPGFNPNAGGPPPFMPPQMDMSTPEAQAMRAKLEATMNQPSKDLLPWQGDFESRRPSATTPPSAGAVDRLSLLRQEWTKYMLSGDVEKADIVQREIDRVESGQSGDMATGAPGRPGGAMRTAGAPSVGGLGGIMSRGPSAATMGASSLPGVQPMDVPDAPQRPTAPTNFSVDDVLALNDRLRGALPDTYARANEIADERFRRAQDRRDNASKDSLFEMGATLAASKNLNLGGAMGEAGLAALKGRRDNERLADKDMDTADETRIKVLEAQRAAALGDMKTAAAIMNTIYDNDARNFQTEAQMYGADQHARTGIFNANVNLQNAASRAEIAQAVAEGRMTQMEANLMLAQMRMQNEAMKGELGARRQDETERQNVFNKLQQNTTKYFESLSKNINNMGKSPAELQQQAQDMAMGDLTEEELKRIGRTKPSGGGAGATLKIGPNGQWVK